MIYFVEYLKGYEYCWEGLFFDNTFNIKISDYLNDEVYENMRDLKIDEKDGTGIFMGSVYESIKPDEFTNRKCYTFKYKGKLFVNLYLDINHAYTTLWIGFWNFFGANS